MKDFYPSFIAFKSENHNFIAEIAPGLYVSVYEYHNSFNFFSLLDLAFVRKGHCKQVITVIDKLSDGNTLFATSHSPA